MVKKKKIGQGYGQNFKRNASNTHFNTLPLIG